MTGEGDLSSLVTLKGRVEGMGVLEGDEGLRQGDMEALEQLWGQLKTLGERTRKNG